jgi:hypothetical protein
MPSIGSIVHYHSHGTPGGEYLPKPRAAIVTCVSELEPNDIPDLLHVGLAVLNPMGMFFNQRVPFSEDPKPGHWSWPPVATPKWSANDLALAQFIDSQNKRK